MDIKTVGIIGFGALGVQFAQRLERGGADVLVLADEARAARYRNEGVLCNGETYVPRVCTPAQAKPVDLLIFATKADGLVAAIETAAAFAKSEFIKAYNFGELKNPGQISNLVRGSSYVFAIMTDPRIK